MDIYYEVKGQGYPLVCVHGNGEDHHIFDELSCQLTDYQLILIDSRYHGQSKKEGEFSYQQMCQDVKSVIDELKLDEYDYLGFSDGAIVGLMLAMSDERMKHMICIGPNTSPQMLKPIYHFTFIVQNLLLLPFCLYDKKARLQRKYLSLMLKEPHINYADLQNIHIPVLVLSGEYDMIKQEDIKHIGESLPYGISKVIKQGNHFLLRDSFQQTYKEMSLFLNACHQEERV